MVTPGSQMTVSGLETEGILRRLELRHSEGAHAVCTAEYLLPGVDRVRHQAIIQKLQRQLGREAAVEDARRVYLRGTVQEVGGTIGFSHSTAVVTIAALTRETDRTPRNRIYQDPEKTFASLCSAARMKGAGIEIMDDKLKNVRVEEIVIQDGETDFQFLRRLAHAMGRPLFADSTQCRLTIGADDHTGGSIAEEDILSLSFSLTEQLEQVVLKTRALLSLGMGAKLGGKLYAVYDVRLHYEDGESVFCYTLRAPNLWEPARAEAGVKFFCAGRAEVTARDDPQHLGRIQVKFLDLEDALPGERAWAGYLPLLTEGDGGIVALPDPGETVEVFVDRGACFAVGCRRGTPLRRRLQDSAVRAAVLRGKALYIGEDKLEGAGFDCRLALDKDELTLSLGKARLQLSEELSQLRCGNSKLNLNQDTAQMLSRVSAEFQAEAVKIEGSSSVSVKTNALDIG